MDPQAFVKLSIGALGLRMPAAVSKTVHLTCTCELKLRGFPVQTVQVPILSHPEGSPDCHANVSIFYLEQSDVRSLLAPNCFRSSQACLEIVVFVGSNGSHCGLNSKRHQIGVVRLAVRSEWIEGKPIVLHNGWIGVGKNKLEGSELHLRVRLDPDPRYVFQFEDETALSPQIVQIQGAIRQPIFSCKFSRERRPSSLDMSGNYWVAANGDTGDEVERRERKGWRIAIHDLCGSAVAAAFIATPFVPATGSDRVSRSNPGAWLIVRPDPSGRPESWCPWGRLEVWRESGAKDFVSFALHVLPEGQDTGMLVSQIRLSADKGGEFFIDMDRQMPIGASPLATQQSKSGELVADGSARPIIGGFVMNCKVQGEGKSSKPSVQLATRHVTCTEDAAIFMALAAAVDLSIEACRPFRRKIKCRPQHRGCLAPRWFSKNLNMIS